MPQAFISSFNFKTQAKVKTIAISVEGEIGNYAWRDPQVDGFMTLKAQQINKNIKFRIRGK